MRIDLKRKIFTDQSTIGQLSINGAPECVTLEDVVRDQKIPKMTAIPAGNYEVTLSYSNRFKRDMPRLENVPEFAGILIHWGNTAVDTEGCILVGKTSSKNFIGSSKTTFNTLFAKLKAVPSSQSIRIYIADD